MIHDVQVMSCLKQMFLQQSFYLNWQVVTEVSIIQILVLFQTDYKSCNPAFIDVNYKSNEGSAVPVLCTHRNCLSGHEKSS